MAEIVNLIIIFCCISLQAFFSGSEMILLSSNKIKLRKKDTKNPAGAKLAVNMINNPRWYLATTSTGTNMAVIVSSVVAAVWFEGVSDTYGELITICVMSPILLLLGEIIPRSFFQQRATEMAPVVARPFFYLSRLISPVTGLVFWASKLFYRRVGSESIEKHSYVSKEELEMILNLHGHGSDVQKEEKKLIRRVFDLSETDLSESMVPLVKVTAVSSTARVKEVLAKVRTTGYSRLPVYKNRIDNIVGIVHSFDLIDAMQPNLPIESFIKEVSYVPELKHVDATLLFLQKSRNSMAVVVNEYGGAVGIITIEDILEMVVGEIEDEYDRKLRQLIRLGDNRYLVSARIEIEYLNDRLEVNIPEGDYDTVGGFLLKHMGRIPQRGETFHYNDLIFTIKRSSKRSIYEIFIDIRDSKSLTDQVQIAKVSS